ncbi:MAG: rRNA pseudouridine synthase [Ignavibacteriae bacterium]|nr:rRNA pseudouridine synthase [Ignavibacteriota bacterium]
MKRSAKPQPVERIRINRYLSMCGAASRRKADQLIQEGKVEVNGKVMTDLGTKIDPRRDKVFLAGKQVARVHEYVYLVMNKPRDAITTLSDERGRTTVMSLMHSKQRVYPIGRLDRNTTGILLFTNDGDFANRLMHPTHEIPKSYRVTTDNPVSREHLDRLRRGIRLEDGMTSPAYVEVLPGGKGREVGITIHEGRNRQVRRMFEELGYDVKKLDRVAYGPVSKEGLARGATRSLTRTEIRTLKELAGMSSTPTDG